MIKKLSILAMIGTLTACGISQSHIYKIPDLEAKRMGFWINQGMQCLYPETLKSNNPNEINAIIEKGGKIKYEVYTSAIMNIALPNTVGKGNAQIIQVIPESNQYFLQQMNKFAQFQKVPNMNDKDCIAFKKMVNTEIARREALQKQQAKEDKARQAFYATPQGQAYLAQQQIIAQQQATIAQQQAYQRQLAEQQQWAEFNASLNQASQNIQNANVNFMNSINQMNYQNQINQLNQSLKGINHSLQRINSSGQPQWYPVY